MRSLLISLAVLFSTLGSAQNILDPVQWQLEWKERASDSTQTLLINAKIDAGWHVYGQEEVDLEFGGPFPTVFTYVTDSTKITTLGNTREPKVPAVYDPVFDAKIVFFEDFATFEQDFIILNNEANQTIEVSVLYSVCDDEKCLPPETKTFSISLEGKSQIVNQRLTERDKQLSKALQIAIKGSEKLTYNDNEKGLLTIFFLGFLGGLIALLTPCVFPMIPLTVSFFTKSQQSRKKGIGNAVLYGLFIFLIYVLLSVPFHLLDSVNPEILNTISTNVTLNIVFFVIFLVFAFSFFGYFEITLPNSWSAKMDAKATRIGGAIGIFFMAVTLALVSFSCTGPILGSLLGGSLSTDGGAMQLTFGMSGFGLALALPFALFALFPNALNKLPKSGGWLNTIKVILGFVELALAFKFLSNADLVQHWGLLKREVFIGIWMLCALGMALYLFGIIRFPHDGKRTKKWRVRHSIFAVLSLVFAGYLAIGLTNTPAANLKLLSGFPPPLFYSIYPKNTTAPLGLNAYKDFNKGMEAAKNTQKPILLDFTGWACVNCRKMEEQVWSDPEVFKLIDQEFTLISLYVDDRKALAEDAQFVFLKANGTTKEIKTIGDKWATFQTVNFQNNSQPYYVLLSPELELLNTPVGYTPNISEFKAWLKEGLVRE